MYTLPCQSFIWSNWTRQKKYIYYFDWQERRVLFPWCTKANMMWIMIVPLRKPAFCSAEKTAYSTSAAKPNHQTLIQQTAASLQKVINHTLMRPNVFSMFAWAVCVGKQIGMWHFIILTESVQMLGLHEQCTTYTLVEVAWQLKCGSINVEHRQSQIASIFFSPRKVCCCVTRMWMSMLFVNA